MRKLDNLEDIYRLSPTQEGMLFQCLYAPGSDIYFEQFCYTFGGSLHGPTLREAWRRVVERHPALRTSFHWEEIDKPLQVVRRRVEVPWRELDWRGLSPSQQEQKLEDFLRDDRAVGFDLTQAPLLRLTLIRVADDLQHFVISSHHIMCDGWSVTLVFGEVSAFYDELRHGRAAQVGRPRAYREYVAWLQRQDLSQAEAFWRETLRGFTFPTRLYVDAAPGAQASPEGAYGLQHYRFSKEETTALDRFAQGNQLTLNTLVQGAWALLMSRHSGEEDVVYGMTVSGRSGGLGDMASMVGLFINTLPVRVRVEPRERLTAWLGRLQLLLAELRQYEHCPLGEILGWSEVARGLPLLQSILVFENYPLLKNLGGEADDLKVVGLRSFEKNNFPLTGLAQPGEELLLKISYDRARFADDVVARLLGQWRTVLSGMLADPGQAVSRVPWLDEAERRLVLFDWNRTRTEYPREGYVHQLFEEQAAGRPEATALLSGSERVTYGELNRRANRLAHHLRSLGVGPEVRVGICVERSVEMVVGLLGILKAGGAYVPLDPEYPPARLDFMLEEASAAVLVTEDRWLDRLSARFAQVVCIDEDWDALIAPQSEEDPEGLNTPDDLVYILYTSGSTGTPKGVCVNHRGVVRLVKGTDYAAMDSGEVFLQLAPLTFDASTFELWGSLLNGATLALAPPSTPSLAEIDEALSRYQVTTLWLTAGLFHLMVDERPEALARLRQMLAGGDVLSAPHVRKYLRRAGRGRLINGYGPTESTTFACCYATRNPDSFGESVPIGRPIANTQAYVLDRHMEPCGVGVAGELYIGGDGLARGYLNGAALTAERFLPHPFADEPGARLYRTGDRARRLADGMLEFVGRLDEQIKVRGHRVEPGEVEAVLRSHPRVRECAVAATERTAAGRRLVGYVVARPSETLDADGLRDFLRRKLPEHLVPSDFVLLDALPLNANGKVDRAALPAPGDQAPERAAAHVAPRDATERTLADIWAEVLGVERVGVTDNFFGLGGDSILSIQIVAKAERAGIQITHKQLFECQTIEKIAAATTAVAPGSVRHEQGLVTGEVPLTPVQRWFFEQNLCDPHHFNQALLLRAKKALDPSLLKEAFGHLLRHHDALRLRFEQVGGAWRQVIAGEPDEVPFARADLSGLDEGEQAARVQELAAEAQAGFRLEQPPLLRAVCFDLGPARPQRLLIVIHHLLVDGISWRILLEDLESAYENLSSGREPALPAKTTSFKEWARQLAEFGRTPAVKDELPYWVEVSRRGGDGGAAIPVDNAQGENTGASAARVSVSLSAAETRALLQGAHRAFDAQVNDLLLTALARAFNGRQGGRGLLLDLEGHGREEVVEGADLSRTVGWFTTIFPVRLELEDAADALGAVRRVKEQLRTIPRRGIGYGLLRYLCDDAAAADALRSLPQATVGFNYLGQLGQMFEASRLFALADEDPGPGRSPRARRSHLIEVDAAVLGEELHAGWSYSENVHRRATVERLAGAFLESLREIAARCASAGAAGQPAHEELLTDFAPEEIEAALGQVEFEGS
ncbi:MAG TPA: amino acid adenylation domain-containing protein [Pyrinomonadaceae bacterium]|jgi:amino acid adenylation domain-containing protein/non-ribosomal peptide synthase protein (TIGR01720 family)